MSSLEDNDDDSSSITVVPINVMKNVLRDSKALLAEKKSKDLIIKSLNSKVEVQKHKILELESLCRDMYEPNETTTTTPSVKKHSISSPTAKERRSSAIQSSSTLSRRTSSIKTIDTVPETCTANIATASPFRPPSVDVKNSPRKKSNLASLISNSPMNNLQQNGVPEGKKIKSFSQMVSKIRNYNSLQHQNEEYQRILRKTRKITSKQSLDEAIRTILHAACTLCKCLSASLFLIDTKNKAFQVTTASRSSQDSPLSTLPEVSIDHSTSRSSIIDYVIESRTKINIQMVSAHPKFNSDVDNQTLRSPIDSMLCYPIVSDEGSLPVLAVFQACNKCPDDDEKNGEDFYSASFTDEDEGTLFNLSESMSSALKSMLLHRESDRAHKRITGLLTMLQDVSEGTTAFEVIERILRVSSKNILEAERLSYFTLSPDKKYLLLNHSSDTQGIRISVEQGLAGYVARTGNDLMIADAYADPRFNSDVDVKTGFVTKSVMCIPVRRQQSLASSSSSSVDEVIGVIQAINKVNGGVFDPTDFAMLRYVARSAAISIHRSMLHDQIVQSKNFTEARMRITNIVSQNVGIDTVMHEVMDAAQLFIDVVATTLFLVDRTKEELWVTNIQGVQKFRIPIGVGLAGTAAKTGELLNIPDAYDVPWFNRGFDKQTGFRTESVLCIPIFDYVPDESKSSEKKDPSRVVAVFQGINRRANGTVVPFSEEDVKMFQEFCDIVSRVLSQIAIDTACLKIFADSNNGEVGSTDKASLLSLYTNQGGLTSSHDITEDETVATIDTTMKTTGTPTSEFQTFEATADWNADILSLTHRETFVFIQKVFKKYGFYDTFTISLPLLKNFLETVRFKYRDNPFHNFHHGFHVFQATFTMLQSRASSEIFGLTSLDTLGVLIAALCHDIDHPGHNNSFEVNSHSALAILHNDDAVLERHHARTTFLVLQNQSNNILWSLSIERFQYVRKLIISTILATDMKGHFTLLKKLDTLTNNQNSLEHQKNSIAESKQIFIDSIVHACDTGSGHTQLTESSVKWGRRMTDEFISQASKEEKLELPTMSFMNNLSDPIQHNVMQLNYCTFILFPYWNCLIKLLPEVKPALENLTRNIEYYRNKITDLETAKAERQVAEEKAAAEKAAAEAKAAALSEAQAKQEQIRKESSK